MPNGNNRVYRTTDGRSFATEEEALAWCEGREAEMVGGKPSPGALPTLRLKPGAAEKPAAAGAPAQEKKSLLGGLKDRKKKGKEEKKPLNPYEQQADSRRKLTAACGALAGVAALALAVGGWQTSQAAAVRQKLEGDMQRVVVAAKDVSAGTVLTASDLTEADVPSSYVPATATASAADLVGHAVITDLTEGVPVATAQVQASGTPSSLAAAVGEGDVAYMLDVSGAAGLSPMLSVGDKVNILSGSGDAGSSAILTDVKVIALDSALSGKASSYSTVTLDLTAEQAETLFAATEAGGGSYHLTLSPAAATEGAE